MKIRTQICFVLLVVLLFSSTPSSIQAHPADQYFQKHTLYLDAETIRVVWSINPGPLLAGWVWNEADADANRDVSEAEAEAWVTSRIGKFTLSLDNSPLEWQIQSITWPAAADDFQIGDSPILVDLQAAWPAISELSQLQLNNQFEEMASIMWYYLHSEAGVVFQKPAQQSGLLTIAFAPIDTVTEEQDDKTWQTYWDTGTPTLPAGTSSTSLPAITGDMIPELTEDTRPFALLTELVRSPVLSLNFILIALAVSAVLGALHALTPGHGKTVVAAYLVGTRGTTKHAITLGSIVTLTHTGSVFALGLLTLGISQYILPTSLFPILEMVSGLLIVGLGAYLVYQRWLDWRYRGGHGHHYHHHHHHDHDHDHDHDHHHHHHHHIPDASDLTWRSLVTLGVSGGIVPCPDAIAILLVAIAINRIVLGLSLIVAFSLGLALVLIVIGLIMVHSRRLFEKMDSFGRIAPIMPIVSAIVVLLLGVGLTVNAIRGTSAFHFDDNRAELVEIPIGVAGANHTEADPDLEPFDLNKAQILYMGRNEANRNQLYLISPDSDVASPLTQEITGITDFALSPNGQTVAYTLLRQGRGTDLWRINLDGSNRRQLVDCENATCSQGIWSPDGQRIIYQKLALGSDDTTRTPNSLWWLDPATGETGPVFQDTQLPGYNPSWSPNGEWLSYNSQGDIGLQLYHLSDGQSFTIPNRTGAPIAWSPDSTVILTSDTLEQDGEFVTHLFRFDLDTKNLVSLSGDDAEVVDSNAIWSPDGAWIALARRHLNDPVNLTGNQLWLMRPDGQEAHPLTDEINVAFGTPNWSPDGAYLVYHRHQLKVANVQPEIFVLNVETKEQQTINASGNRPIWVEPGNVAIQNSP